MTKKEIKKIIESFLKSMKKKIANAFRKDIPINNALINKIFKKINCLENKQPNELQSDRFEISSFSKNNFIYKLLITLNKLNHQIYLGFEIQSKPSAILKNKLIINTNFQLKNLPEDSNYHTIFSISCNEPIILL